MTDPEKAVAQRNEAYRLYLAAVEDLKEKVARISREPPLLSDEEIKQACRNGFVWYPIISTADRNIAQAQRDADVRFYHVRL